MTITDRATMSRADKYHVDPHKLFLNTDTQTIRFEADHDMRMLMLRTREDAWPSLGEGSEFVVLALNVDDEHIDEVWVSGKDGLDQVSQAIEALEVVRAKLLFLDRWSRGLIGDDA